MKFKKKIIAFIPARGGSKSIINKNLKKINEQSLVQITLKKAIKSKLFKNIVLSSNNNKILKEGKKFKVVNIFKRPNRISSDKSTTESAISHYLLNSNFDAEYLVVLQPTSPLRKIKTVINFVNHCVKNRYTNCLSVTLKKEHISRVKKYFKPLESVKIRRRQNRKGFLVENGMLYFIKINDFLKKKKIFSKKWNYYITDEYESIDINNYKDLQIAKLIYNKI